MKACAILFVLTVATYTKAQAPDEIVQFREDCIKESGVDPALITKAEAGDFSTDQKLKCFTKCFYIKQGWMDADGKMQYDHIKSKIPESANKEEAQKVIDVCVAKAEITDPCEVAYDVHKCYYEHTPKFAPTENPPK